MNDRLAFCDVCEDAYPEDFPEEHEHQEERLAERRFLMISEELAELPPSNKRTAEVTERIAKIRKMALYFAGDAASGMTWWEYRQTLVADLLWMLEQLEATTA